MCVPGELVLVGGREQTIETGAAVQQDGLIALLYRSKRDEGTECVLFTGGV